MSERYKFLNIDHQVLKDFRSENLEGQSLTVAVSGGSDSVAILCILKKISSILSLNLSVAHIHHGISEDNKQRAYRDKAFYFTKALCKKWSLCFLSNVELQDRFVFKRQPEKELQSEAELRSFRYSCLKDLMDSQSLVESQKLVTGHNSDDLLETRLIQLIRGVGPEGLAQSIFSRDERIWPLAKFSRREILDYLKASKQDYLEDVSNRDSNPLRNWIRNSWLPQLEQKRKGSVQKMSQSLNLLSQFLNQNVSHHKDLFFHSQSLNIEDFKDLDLKTKSLILTAYLKSLDFKDYSQAHVEEILKRLASPRKSFSFDMLSETWEVAAGHLMRRT